MSPALKQNPDMAAFTLVEVLIAVAIFAIVLAAINTVFFGAMRLRARTTEATEAILPVDRAVAIMKRDMAGIVQPGVMAGAVSSDITVVGLSQPVALEIFSATGVINDSTPWGDIQKIDYSLQDSTNTAVASGKDLVRSVTRNLLASATETPEQQSLLEDVQSLQFSYYDGTNWSDAWSASSNSSNAPAAIKVHIEFAAARPDQQMRMPVQFLVPIFAQALTNQTNQAQANN
ncbi:MAG: hypothetical protein JWR19_3156 [Pedosphaera sp.]|nr:hypothetical protein [Pedosphaera sp.]